MYDLDAISFFCFLGVIVNEVKDGTILLKKKCTDGGFKSVRVGTEIWLVHPGSGLGP